jgi:hypothetical protein
VYPQFELGYLAGPGCSPLYLAGGVADGCPMFRDEPAWGELSLRWTGPGLAQVWPRNGRFANAWLEDGHRRRPLRVDITVTDASGTPANDGALELADGSEVRVRLDFSRAMASLPRGPHRLCYELTATTTPETPPRGRPECLPIVVVEPDTVRERAEHLRRKAIDLVAGFRCSEALPVIEDLLRVHPASASAFRLRGIVEELQQRNEAAVRDYSRAIWLLRTGGDHLLSAPGVDFQQSAKDLADWRDSMQTLLTFAPEMSMLGPPGERPACKSSSTR